MHLSTICCLLLLLHLAHSDTVVSSADLDNGFTPTTNAWYHTAGLSMSFPQVIPYWNNSVFASRINASFFLGFQSAFYQTYHVPKGYKYNCSSTIYGSNVTCTLDLATNTSLLNLMANFIYGTAAYYCCDVGYDMEKSNFTKSSYINNFLSYLPYYGNYGYNMELIDMADQFSSLYNRTYTATNWMSDLTSITNRVYGIIFNGPGITEAADSSWVSQISTMTNYYGFAFTFRCLVFKNSSQATIANLMSQNYSGAYLRNRLKDSSNNTLDLISYVVGISQIRLTNDSGVNGVTNSFAAALWALDLCVEFAAMGGKFLNFYNPLTASNQSVFGAGPAFVPGAIYYGLLFATYALMDGAMINRATVTSGTSASIKVYGLDVSYNYRILIINKDMNSNVSGVVQIKYGYTPGMRCYYLSAPSLSSTINITYAGMQFVANSSDYSGSFEYTDYKPNPLGIYSINVNYSQAVLCEQIQSSTSYTPLPRGRSSDLHEAFSLLATALLTYFVLVLQ